MSKFIEVVCCDEEIVLINVDAIAEIVAAKEVVLTVAQLEQLMTDCYALGNDSVGEPVAIKLHQAKDGVYFDVMNASSKYLTPQFNYIKELEK